MLKKLIYTLGITALTLGPVEAASLYFVGDGKIDTLNRHFSLSHVPGVQKGDTVTIFDKNNRGGLAVADATSVTFEYLGSEAGFFNKFNYDGSTLFQNKNFKHRRKPWKNSSASKPFIDTVTFDYVSTQNVETKRGDSFLDLLNFSFWTSASMNHNRKGREIDNGKLYRSYAIAFSSIVENSVIALFGDGTGDKDFDDLAVRITVNGDATTVPDISPVPVPGALPMFLTGLAGLAYLRHRNRSKEG